jgi:hypothetical protein
MMHARELAMLPKAELWQLSDGPIKVVFDDGVVESHGRATIYSTYMWDLYAKYPKTPALMEHHLGDNHVGSNTHLDLLGKVMWACYDAYEHEVPDKKDFVEELCGEVYDATNRLYNDMTYRLESRVRTLSILDFVQVVLHPKIKEANDNVQPTRLSVDKCYKTINDVLKDPRELRGNPVADAAKNGLVDMRQIQQCVGPRGAVTDVDSNYFRDQVLRGYVHGLISLQDSMMESRSAAKSLMFTEEPLQKSEYFNRQLQLLCGTLEFLHMGDCGTKETLKWRVKPGDLKALAGKYYNTPSGLKRLRETDRHLTGELIEMRSVLVCQHPDPRGVCSTCFGEMSLSIPKETCLGHVSATALCEMVSQSVLSIKHVDSSSGAGDIELTEYEQQYFRVGTDTNTLKLAERLEKVRVVLTISAKEAEHLSDITFVDDVRALPVSRISELNDVQLVITGQRGEESVILPVANGTRKGSLTHDALAYIKEHSWSLTATGNYSIDLSSWDMEWPLFEMPLKHENMLDYMATIEKFIKATEGGTQRTLKDCVTLEQALLELNTLVASELTVNIAHLEVILKSVTIRSSEHHDYRIPHAGNAVEFGSFTNIMASRSLAATMAYQGHKKVLLDPAAYIRNQRPSHPLDAMILG